MDDPTDPRLIEIKHNSSLNPQHTRKEEIIIWLEGTGEKERARDIQEN